MIISERPRLLEIDVGKSGSYALDVQDFWRPLDRKDALTDGHFSVQCYLDALQGAYAEWRACGGDPGGLVRTCYHVPYGKMSRKAHRHRRMIDGLTEQRADASFVLEVEPSLELPAQIGNIYTGSLYLALASLLHLQAEQLGGERLGLFSYGSGCTAEFFSGRVHPEAEALVRRLDIAAPLAARRRLGIPEYEELRRRDAASDRRPAPGGTQAHGIPGNMNGVYASLAGHVRFLGIDEGERRVYL